MQKIVLISAILLATMFVVPVMAQLPGTSEVSAGGSIDDTSGYRYSLGELNPSFLTPFADNNANNQYMSVGDNFIVDPSAQEGAVKEQIVTAKVGGKEYKIYLPAISADNKGLYVYLYVGTDGSTYYMDSNNDGTGAVLCTKDAFTEKHLARKSPTYVAGANNPLAAADVTDASSDKLQVFIGLGAQRTLSCANEKKVDISKEEAKAAEELQKKILPKIVPIGDVAIKQKVDDLVNKGQLSALIKEEIVSTKVENGLGVVEGVKQGKLLGVFTIPVTITVTVNPDTLEQKVSKPFWSFLVTGLDGIGARSGSGQQGLTAPADLAVTDLNWKWVPGQQFKTFTFTITVKNQGTRTASDFAIGITDTINLNPKTGLPTVIGICRKTLASGASTSCSFNYIKPALPNFGVNGDADTENKITESDKNNNRKSISVQYCGDGVQDSDTGEECDDGNRVDTDLCSNSCKFNPYCGDGTCDSDENSTNCVSDCGSTLPAPTP